MAGVGTVATLACAEWGPPVVVAWAASAVAAVVLATTAAATVVARAAAMEVVARAQHGDCDRSYTRPHEVPDCPKASRLSTFCYYKLRFDTTKYFLQVRGGARAKPADFSANYQRDHEQLNSRPQSRS